MRLLPHPFAIRHQNHGQAVPAREEAAKAHRSRVAFGVIGVDELDRIERKSDQDDDMAGSAAVRRRRETEGITFPVRRSSAQADRSPQFFLNGVVKYASATAARILHAIMNARFPQRLFQTAGTTRAGMAVGESVNRFQTMMASQCLQGAPAAPSRRSILDPTVGSDVDLLRHGRRGDEHQAKERDGIQGSEHGKILFPRGDDLPSDSQPAIPGGDESFLVQSWKVRRYYYNYCHSFNLNWTPLRAWAAVSTPCPTRNLTDLLP